MKKEDLVEQMVMDFVAPRRLETSAPHHRGSVFGLLSLSAGRWRHDELFENQRLSQVESG